jgi:hypothetical protein
MKEIKLTQEKVALVDDEDFEYLSSFKWFAHKSFNTYYAVTTKKTIGMHHFIIGKPPKGLVTDHIDGDGLNNQKSNLRHVSVRENGQNLHIQKTSKYTGATLHRGGKWMSQITINGKSKYLGLFDKEELAHLAYKKALVLLNTSESL